MSKLSINMNPRYFKPIETGAVTGIIVPTLKKNLYIGDCITITFNGFDTEDLEVFVTDIERIRLDELKIKHIVACGYSHEDILEDHLIRDFGIDPEDGELFYFIGFDNTVYEALYGKSLHKLHNKKTNPILSDDCLDATRISFPKKNIIQKLRDQEQKAFLVRDYTYF